MDNIDKNILRILKNDAKISNQDLAQQISLSPSACLRRVQELEKKQIIEGYRARINPASLDRSFIVYVSVGLAEHTKDAQNLFEAAMAVSHDVTECYNIAGAFEYLLRVETKDMATYKQFHTEYLGAVKGIRSISSHMVMGVAKDDRS